MNKRWMWRLMAIRDAAARGTMPVFRGDSRYWALVNVEEGGVRWSRDCRRGMLKPRPGLERERERERYREWRRVEEGKGTRVGSFLVLPWTAKTRGSD